jgi:FeS assembly protein IscX
MSSGQRLLMKLKWTDVQEIAIELVEKFPEIDPKSLKFTDLYDWVLALENFDDDPKRCGEKVLEAIQSAWIEEVQ